MATISVFLTSIYPSLWPGFVEMLRKSTAHPFEVIISGPKPCDTPIPEVVYIHSTDQPVTALEIAQKQCKSEFIVQAVDDVAYSPGALDKMLAAVTAEPQVIASCNYWLNGKSEPLVHRLSIFGKVESSAPMVPICPMLRRADWLTQDPVFIRQYGDLDVYLRLILKGWKTVLVDATVSENARADSLWMRGGQYDLTKCRSLWVDSDGRYCPSLRYK